MAGRLGNVLFWASIGIAAFWLYGVYGPDGGIKLPSSFLLVGRFATFSQDVVRDVGELSRITLMGELAHRQTRLETL